eukprot:CAMPEP_0177760274 /NCGR_PEP_ID=MMETSP0491_2-20121128/5181_1 /TAXON_ID=63592 /ORGANISM="Tetraselmis chuii, Strain PLY429" /LENGTH=795 /DNA_ID=CAMNT_0019276165 /DNA_START=278 /DNA_END=2665 /DNA_ORIENTATION=-
MASGLSSLGSRPIAAPSSSRVAGGRSGRRPMLRNPAGLVPAPLWTVRGANGVSSSAAASGDWKRSNDELYKLQQELLEEVAERKKLAAQLVQRLRKEAAEGSICIDESKVQPAPFSSSSPSPPSISAPSSSSTSATAVTAKNTVAPATTAVKTAPRPSPVKQPSPPPPATVRQPPTAVRPASSPPQKAPTMPPTSTAFVDAPAQKKAAPSTPPRKEAKPLPPVGAPPNLRGAPPSTTPAAPKAPKSTEPKAKTASAAPVGSPPKSLQFPGAPPPARTAEVEADVEEPAGVGATKELPLAGENVMKVVMVGAEMAPWSKTGGLGDVMGALPKALAHRGHRTMAIAPRYENYEGATDTGVLVRFRVFNSDHEVRYYHQYKDGVDYVFIDHPVYHNAGKNIYTHGSRLDLGFRCALLCKAALEAPWHVPCGGVPYGDDNLCFIANDWHTSLLPVYLQGHYRDYEKMTFARAILVLHNMAHQGRAPFDELSNFEIPQHMEHSFYLDDPIGGEHMNILKAGIESAHRLVAVSHGYAWECQTQEGGWGLDMYLRDMSWKFRGIVNGIDLHEWNPATDEALTTDGYKQFTKETLATGKAACKAALQKEFGLKVDPDVPLLGFIGRLDYQKGIDLIRDSYDWLMGQNVQMIMLGSGRDDLENDLRSMEARNPNCKAWVGFNVTMAHRITAGIDILLMPSRFEPCGLNQLYAMAYGTVPLVHAVGGLRDTVQPYDPYENSGTGWTFDRAEAEPFKSACNNALVTFKNHRESFRALQERGMEKDMSWEHAAEQYEEVMVAAKYQW